MKLIDLTIPLGIGTPPWPTYEPLQLKYFKRLAPNGANGQVLTHSNHLGTHLDGEIHFYTAGKDIAELELDFLVHEGVVVDLSDVAVGLRHLHLADGRGPRRGEGGRHPHHPHRLPPLRLGHAHGARDPLHGPAPRPRPRVRGMGQGKEAALDRRRLRQRRSPDEHHHPRLDAAPGQASRGPLPEEVRQAPWPMSSMTPSTS